MIHRRSRPSHGTGAALGLLVAGLLVSASASAQVKLGFVNVPKVLNTAPQSQAARHRIEQEFAPRDRELLAQQKHLRALEDKLLKNGSVMSSDQRGKQETEVRALRRRLRRMQNAFREDLNVRRSQELTRLRKKVADVIRGVAESERYDIILSNGVIYAGDRIDITDKIIARLKAEFKASGN